MTALEEAVDKKKALITKLFLNMGQEQAEETVVLIDEYCGLVARLGVEQISVAAVVQVRKLDTVLKQWDGKSEDFFKECSTARKHNYNLEAIMLDEKYKLVRDLCMEVRMKVVEQLIAV